MSELKGNGKPSRDTQAAIGDIYTDNSTGCKYKCTFGYSDGETYVTEWAKLNDVGILVDKKKINLGEDKKVDIAPVVENAEEEAKKSTNEQNNRNGGGSNHSRNKNYTNYNKMNNK